MNALLWVEHLNHHFLVGLLCCTHKKMMRRCSSQRGAFIINDFLRNLHFTNLFTRCKNVIPGPERILTIAVHKRNLQFFGHFWPLLPSHQQCAIFQKTLKKYCQKVLSAVLSKITITKDINEDHQKVASKSTIKLHTIKKHCQKLIAKSPLKIAVNNYTSIVI
jgi:hypothetical protein